MGLGKGECYTEVPKSVWQMMHHKVLRFFPQCLGMIANELRNIKQIKRKLDKKEEEVAEIE